MANRFFTVFAGLVGWLSVSLAFSVPTMIYPFSDPAKSQQFHQLISELRCVVCQNQNLLDSDAKLAADLRQQIYQQVQLGRSNAEILRYMTKRYGDFVLFSPPFKPITFLLWLLPWFGIGVGVWVWFKSGRAVTC